MVRISSRQLFGAIKKLKYRKVKFWLRQKKYNKRQQKHNQKLKLPFVRIVKKTYTKIFSVENLQRRLSYKLYQHNLISFTFTFKKSKRPKPTANQNFGLF